jgi:DNA-binding XRE family transcriptional regulator
LKKARTNLQKLREDHLLSKAELARRAGVSPLTIDRIEAGMTCRLDTKRKIILGLGLSVTERERVFGDKERRKPGIKR